MEALIGRRVFTSPDAARVIVRGVIEDGPSGVRVHIQASGARGEALGTRELVAPPGQCATLRDAIGLVLTLFVEYEEPSASETVLGFGAEASLADGPLPRIAFSAGPALYLALGPVLRLHASAAYWPRVSIRTARGVGATLEAFSLKLRGCARGWAGLGLCAGVEGGALLAEPLELAGPERQVRLLAQGLLDASWEVELASVLRADLGVGSLFSLSRPEFSYLRADGGRMAVYRPPLAGVIFRCTLIIVGE